jgi:uncharacterized membrane protein
MKNVIDFGDLFDKTIKDIKGNFKNYIIIMLLFSFIPFVLYDIYSYFYPMGEEINLNFLKHIILISIMSLISSISTISIIYSSIKKEKDWKESVRKSLNYYPIIILGSIIVTLFLIPLFMLLIIPGLIFSIYWLLFIYVIIDENEKIMKSLKRSKFLIKGHWWNVFGKILLIILIFIGIIILVMIFFALLILTPYLLLKGLQSLNDLDIVMNILINITTILFTLFYILFMKNLYFNLKDIYRHKKEDKKKMIN